MIITNWLLINNIKYLIFVLSIEFTFPSSELMLFFLQQNIIINIMLT